MTGSLCLLLLFFLPFGAGAQAIARADSLELSVIQEDCGERIFTKVEKLPSLRKGTKNFEDTLTACLKSINEFKNGASCVFRFLVTTKSHLLLIEKETIVDTKEDIIRSILTSYSYMWKSAIQNGRMVCAYVRLKIDIANDKLNITVMDNK